MMIRNNKKSRGQKNYLSATLINNSKKIRQWNRWVNHLENRLFSMNSPNMETGPNLVYANVGNCFTDWTTTSLYLHETLFWITLLNLLSSKNYWSRGRSKAVRKNKWRGKNVNNPNLAKKYNITKNCNEGYPIRRVLIACYHFSFGFWGKEKYEK